MRGRSGRPARARAPEWAVLVAVALAVVIVDQVTKAVVRARVPFGETADGLGPFFVHHVRNSGIVHGLLPGSAPILAAATGVIVLGILAYFARRGAGRPAFAVAVGLLVGGSVGNLADRARLGYVTDFLDRDGGGAFNLADVAITLAALLLLVSALTGARRPEPAGQIE